MKQLKPLHTLLLFLAIFAVLYAYYFPWQTHTVYGDDIFIIKESDNFRFSDFIHHPLDSMNDRSVNRILIYAVIALLKRHLYLYYILNVLVQVTVTMILAFTVNIILRSWFFSIAFSLILGFSRFSYYSISQLTFGGPMEGIGMVFFLLMLHYILKAMRTPQDTSGVVNKNLLWGILYASICLQVTHPRYIVLFPFIILVVLFFPFPAKLKNREKAVLSLVTVASVGFFVFVKKIINHQDLLIGTGGSEFHFSFASAFGYLMEAIMAIFQVSIGPEYLSGITFFSLPLFEQILAAVIFTVSIISIVLMLYRASLFVFRYYFTKLLASPVFRDDVNTQYVSEIFFLTMLMLACLAPAISTIRLEQRWLMAPFAIFIIMLAMVLSTVKYKANAVKYTVFSILALSFIWLNASYLYKGVRSIYMYGAEMSAARFENALEKDLIHARTKRVYLWVKKIDPNVVNEVNWVLGNGYFFTMHNVIEKEIVFVDSMYAPKDGSYVYAFNDFDPQTTQIITYGLEFKDITSEYLKDSLETFMISQK